MKKLMYFFNEESNAEDETSDWSSDEEDSSWNNSKNTKVCIYKYIKYH